MKMKWAVLMVWILALVLCLSLAVSCGDDDDDDDSGSSADDDDDDNDDDTQSATAEQFCALVDSCDDADAYLIDGACEAGAAGMSAETLDCALLTDCVAFISCVEATEEGWNLDPMTITAVIPYISAPDFVFYQMYEKSPIKISPNELGKITYQYDDNDECDIKGGQIWVSDNGGEFVSVGGISPSAPCKMVGNTELTGFNIEGDYKTVGSHQITTVMTDVNGQQSAPKIMTYTIEEHPYAIGATMDFTLSGINGPAKTLGDVSREDFDGDVILVDVSAMWCPTCKDEAGELQAIQDDYAGENLQVITLLGEDYQGGEVDESELDTWATTYGLTIPILTDPGYAAGWPWNIGPYIPFNLILDQDGVCRYKLIGYYGPYLTDVIDELLGID